MRMHKNILGGGHLLGNNSPVARRHRCADVGRPLPARGSRHAFRLATAPRAVAAGASFALVMLAGVLLFPTIPDSAHAETPVTPTEASPRATTSVSLTVPATIEFADVMATPSGATTTASATIGVTTTASAGYKLYLYAKDNSLKSLNPNTTQSIASASASSLDNFTNNTWGYNLTEGTTAGTTYSALPTTNTTPTQTKDTSTTNSANDTYTLSLGAKVDSTIPSGTYTSTLTISVVAEPALVTIAFNGNGATSGSMDSLRIPAGSSQTLPSNIFARTNYNYDGWNTSATGNGASYADGSTYIAPADAAGTTITLYAQWADPYIMQDFTAADCKSKASQANVYVRDSRDQNIYTARYINGTCWMTQNLRLSGRRTLTPSDSDVDSNWTLPNINLSSGNTYTQSRFAINSNISYGGYYNYCAASAGKICSSNSLQGTDQSICPAGWGLPTQNQLSAVIGYPAEFLPVSSGGYSGGGLRDTGAYGYWWSSTVSGASSQYDLRYSQSEGSLIISIADRYFGLSVRCVRSN